MFARLEMELKVENDELLQYNKGVILQGVMMEKISSEYAEILHESGLHPYSQYVVTENGINKWNICVTNKKAYEEIIVPMVDDDFSEFEIEQKNIKVKIAEKVLHKKTMSDFMETFYFEDGERYIDIIFRTPAAFKQMNRYVYYPDITLIYKSLMNKYDASSDDSTVKSEEVMGNLTENSSIVKYNLHSCTYNIGTVKIPAFMGSITIKVNGTQAMVNFANMLFRFGEYSGIGIKTAMGMGCIKIAERRKNDRRKDTTDNRQFTA